MDNYQRQNESKTNLSVADFCNIIASNQHKDKEYYLSVAEQLGTLEVTADTTLKLINSIVNNKKLKEISLAAYDAVEGRVELDDVRSLFTDFLDNNETVTEESNIEFSSDDLEELLNNTISKPGLRWRLNSLNKMLGSLRKGDFGFVFARPETGKTTLLASEVTYMAEQLGEADGPILWINNEEQSDKVKVRCIQASLGISLAQLRSNLPAVQEEYLAKTKGKLKIIKNKPIIHKNEVEALCKKLQPSLIIFDQIDKIVGFDDDRNDLRLGKVYQWARDIASRCAPVIAVCQADGTGEGVKWLTMSNVADAKTSKQAEADWILGVGCSHDAGYEAIRYLHASKNKLMGDDDSDPQMKHGKIEVIIEPHVARYKDI